MGKHKTLDLATIKDLIKLGLLIKPGKRKTGKTKKYKYSKRQVLDAMKQ